MTPFAPLFAQQSTRTTFEWARIETPGQWLLPLAIFAAFGLYVRFMYRRDAVELNALTRRVLLGLRMVAIVVLLFAFLQPQWRNEAETVANSRVALQIDGSSSMAYVDPVDAPADGSSALPKPVSRSQQLIDNLSRGELIAELRKKHDVVVWRFDRDAARLATLPRIRESDDRTAPTPESDSDLWRGRNLLLGMAGAVTIFALSGVWFVAARQARGRGGVVPATLLILAAGTLVAGGGMLAVHHTPESLLELAGLKKPREFASERDEMQEPPDANWWKESLQPQGGETRLGEGIKHVLDEERGAPLAAIVVFTDGRQNAGLELPAAQAAAIERKVPVYTVGIGSDKQPTNVRIADFRAPQRAYPGDRFSVSGTLQHEGMAGLPVTVELSSRPATPSAAGSPEAISRLESSLQVKLGKEGEIATAPFELPAPTESDLGRRVYRIAVRPTQPDDFPADDAQEAEIEIVDRKTRVLLLSGGPSREYQFLRNQLKRGSDATVDVLLQSGTPGMSQDAHEILTGFPATRQEMFEYDCVVALDPDWREFTPQQIELLEAWVGEQAGGLIVAAGRVFTRQWTEARDDGMLAKVRALYPVEFQRGLQVLDDESEDAATDPHRIELSREGIAADFLTIADDPIASRNAWTDFAGAYECFSVRGTKPGATTYAYFALPDAPRQEDQPAYFTGQFYGLGRVFYLGSCETWRLRAHDHTYFERFWSKTIRHVSQGRLLRGSKRGVVLTDADRYMLGAAVDVRAQLTNAQFEPLALERVMLDVLIEGQKVQSVELLRDATRVGNFRGQFTARREGAYQISLPVPESNDEVLTRAFKVRVPDLERENVSRDDARLRELAEATGGEYRVGLESLTPPDGPSLASRLPDKSRTVTLPLTPDTLWDNWWVISTLVAVLGLEWLLRRLVKLA